MSANADQGMTRALRAAGEPPTLSEVDLRTFSGLIEQLELAKGLAQGVREAWPAEAEGELELEHAIEQMGQSVLGLEEAKGWADR